MLRFGLIFVVCFLFFVTFWLDFCCVIWFLFIDPGGVVWFGLGFSLLCALRFSLLLLWCAVALVLVVLF